MPPKRIKLPPEAVILNLHLPLGTPHPHLYQYFPLAAVVMSAKPQPEFFSSTKTDLKAATSLWHSLLPHQALPNSDIHLFSITALKCEAL